VKPNRPLDLDKIARGLRAERRGSRAARSGYFAAAQLGAAVLERFRVPAGGGRATDPSWTARRLVPLAPHTLDQLASSWQRCSGQCLAVAR